MIGLTSTFPFQYFFCLCSSCSCNFVFSNSCFFVVCLYLFLQIFSVYFFLFLWLLVVYSFHVFFFIYLSTFFSLLIPLVLFSFSLLFFSSAFLCLFLLFILFIQFNLVIRQSIFDMVSSKTSESFQTFSTISSFRRTFLDQINAP